jgi:hypothetical protein
MGARSDARIEALVDAAGYWISIVGLYLMQGALWYYPFKEKVYEPQRRKPVLLGALALGLFTFALLLFGDTMTAQYDGVASLFTYFGVTVVLMGFVLLMPPYRKRWLSGALKG